MTDQPESGQTPQPNAPQPPRPGALQARLFRAPVKLYQAHLGFVLGGRFLMITHVGRKSGLTRRTVVEVARHDPDVPEWYVVSGFGPRSDWFRNLQANPALRIDVGTHHFVPEQRFLGVAQTEELLRDYQRRHPRAAKELGKRLLGADFDASPESLHSLAERMPAVAFRPAPDAVSDEE
ncbi:MAG: nitroreductase family deazaflavin-dependent oxidoreductase [Candidatus Nanopelagicales bacterium]